MSRVRHNKPEGFCRVYDGRPADCRVHECEVSLKTLGRVCQEGCVDCCMDRDVVYDEQSGLYVVQPGGKGPCKQIEFTNKPKWVGKEEERRDQPEPMVADPSEAFERAEQLKALQAGLRSLDASDRKFISDVFGLEGKALGLEKACAERKIPLEEGQKRYDALLLKLRKRMEK